MNGMTGYHLKMARLIYGFPTQESLATAMETTVGTIQRYESLKEVSYKIIGEYEHRVHFDPSSIHRFIVKSQKERLTKSVNG